MSKPEAATDSSTPTAESAPERVERAAGSPAPRDAQAVLNEAGQRLLELLDGYGLDLVAFLETRKIEGGGFVIDPRWTLKFKR